MKFNTMPFPQVVRDTFSVTQQFDVTIFAAAVYYYVLSGRLQPVGLQAVSGAHYQSHLARQALAARTRKRGRHLK